MVLQGFLDAVNFAIITRFQALQQTTEGVLFFDYIFPLVYFLLLLDFLIEKTKVFSFKRFRTRTLKL